MTYSIDGLQLLLVGSLIASFLLLLVSTAILGRKLSDRDYQRETGIDGTLKIQVIKEIRTHGMRVFVAITFGTFAILLIADAPMVIRQWVNRTLFLLVPLGYTIATCLDWIAEKQQQKIEIDAERAARAKDALK